MPIEIERKFLLASEDWRKEADQGTIFKQGYLNSQKERTVRIRVAGAKGLITVKGVTVKNSRAEFEYEIPLVDAEELLLLCEKPLIEKRRYIVMSNGMAWEIDVFEGENQGLILAEVELESEEQEIVLPAWIGEEVSGDARYYNANLVGMPFRTW